MNPMNTMDTPMTHDAPYAPQQEVSAAQLGESLTLDAPPPEHAAMDAYQSEEERLAAVREGIGELFEDGWTANELSALAQSPAARQAIAEGKSVARAACAFLREHAAPQRRSAVPTARAVPAGDAPGRLALDAMTDAEFDAFSRRAQAAAMAGNRVRI